MGIRTQRDIGLTTEYPCAGFRIEALHLPLVRLPLVRKLLGTSPVTTCVSRVALLERTRHRITLSIRARTQSHVILILLVDEVLILGRSLAVGGVSELVSYADRKEGVAYRYPSRRSRVMERWL